ncbi:MAG TPA: nucleotidyltransferase domain-containing protein [Actinopolymorphaceae bacterium]
MLAEEDALRIADGFAQAVHASHPDEVVAVVLVGSLPVGDYIPGRSDIDTVVVVTDECPPSVCEDIQAMASSLQRHHEIPKGLGAVVVTLNQLVAPLDPKLELAPEILDVIERGHVIAGRLDISSIRTPTEADFRAYCKEFIPWLRRERRDPDRPAANRTPDANVNSLLYELRLAVLALRGRYVLRKRTVIPAFLACDPAIPESARQTLEQIHQYVLGHVPTPDNATIDRIRDAVERYNDLVAAWAFPG